MENKTFMGTITFIHHEKNYATIEYLDKEKKKSINGNVSEAVQQQWVAKKIIKKPHAFRIGDTVSFVLTLAPKGDKMIADLVEFRYNNAYTNLIAKTEIENRFVGYLKKVDDKYFVKETGSYILFPLVISPWEKLPHESRLNEPVFFKINNPEKPDHATASFFKSEYIPEYQAALRSFNAKTPVEAKVTKVTPYGIFVELFTGKIQSKIALAKNPNAPAPTANPGDTLQVMITYVGPTKIVVELL